MKTLESKIGLPRRYAPRKDSAVITRNAKHDDVIQVLKTQPFEVRAVYTALTSKGWIIEITSPLEGEVVRFAKRIERVRGNVKETPHPVLLPQGEKGCSFHTSEPSVFKYEQYIHKCTRFFRKASRAKEE